MNYYYMELGAITLTVLILVISQVFLQTKEFIKHNALEGYSLLDVENE